MPCGPAALNDTRAERINVAWPHSYKSAPIFVFLVSATLTFQALGGVGPLGRRLPPAETPQALLHPTSTSVKRIVAVKKIPCLRATRQLAPESANV